MLDGPKNFEHFNPRKSYVAKVMLKIYPSS